MANVFDTLKSYAGNWNVTNTRKFSEEEKSAISRTEVVSGQWGLSVCFFMKNGRQNYIPVSQDSNLGVGDSLDINNASLLTLERDGETCLKVHE